MPKTVHIDHGFIALIAVIILAMGTIAFSLVALGAAASYADTVTKREIRIQARQNREACADVEKLIRARDAVWTGTTMVPDLGCTLPL